MGLEALPHCQTICTGWQSATGAGAPTSVRHSGQEEWGAVALLRTSHLPSVTSHLPVPSSPGPAEVPPGWADLRGRVTSPGWEGPRGMRAWGGVLSRRGLWVMEPQPPEVQRGAEHGLPQGGVSPDHPWEELALFIFHCGEEDRAGGLLSRCLVLPPSSHCPVLPATSGPPPTPNPHPTRGTPGSLPTRRKSPSSQSPGYHPLSSLSLLIRKWGRQRPPQVVRRNSSAERSWHREGAV